MRKIEIKTIGIILSVMILLNLTQAQLDRNSQEDRCRLRCILKCGIRHLCFQDCASHCHAVSPSPAYNCINNCHLIKYIASDIGMYPLKIFIYFHCFNFIFDFINYFFSVI